MIEIREDDTGLFIGRDVRGFMAAAQRKSGKKRTLMRPSTYARNLKMLEISISLGNRPLISDTDKPVIYIQTHFTPPKWTETITKVKAVYYQKAIEHMADRADASAYLLTLNLTPIFARKALMNGGLTYIHDRISKRFSRLDTPAEFWLTLEAVTKDRHGGWNRREGRPHVHGGILLQSDHIDTAKQIFRTLNGAASLAFRQNETRFKLPEEQKGGGSGWAEYSFKHNGYNQLFMPDSNRLSRTQGVSKVARQLYDADRAAIRVLSRGV